MVQHFQDQNYGMSSWEKLTFPTPSLRVQSRLQSCRGRPKHLCRLRRRLYCWKNSPNMVCALQARQFLREWHFTLGAASGGIWRGLSIMDSLRGTWPSLLNAIVNNFAVWRKQSSKNARVDDMEWFFSMTTLDHTLQTWRKRPFRNSTTRFFHIRPTLRTLPHRITTFSALLQSARSFLQQRLWAPKLARRLHGQIGGVFQAWDRKPARTLGGSREKWRRIHNWLIVLLIVWKMNYLKHRTNFAPTRYKQAWLLLSLCFIIKSKEECLIVLGL
jgi:hypothetical protein